MGMLFGVATAKLEFSKKLHNYGAGSSLFYRDFPTTGPYTLVTK